MSLLVFLPETAQDVYDREADILRCIYAEEGIQPDSDIIAWLAKYPHTIYLFYDGDALVGWIRLDDRAMNPALGKHTVQIHGATLPEYRGWADEPAKFVMTLAFKAKKTVIAKVNPNNVGAVGFCRKWNFRKINREHGLDVYALKRSEFERMAG